jgi:hypothetical protein
MFRSAWCINTDWVSWRSDDSTLWRGERCYNDWSSDARSVAWAARDNTWVRDTDQRWYSGWWCHWQDGWRSSRHNEPEPEQPIARCDSWKDGCSWNDGWRGWRNGNLAYERCNGFERDQPIASGNEETLEESIETARVNLKRLQEERAMRQRLMQAHSVSPPPPEWGCLCSTKTKEAGAGQGYVCGKTHQRQLANLCRATACPESIENVDPWRQRASGATQSPQTAASSSSKPQLPHPPPSTEPPFVSIVPQTPDGEQTTRRREYCINFSRGVKFCGAKLCSRECLYDHYDDYYPEDTSERGA